MNTAANEQIIHFQEGTGFALDFMGSMNTIHVGYYGAFHFADVRGNVAQKEGTTFPEFVKIKHGEDVIELKRTRSAIPAAQFNRMGYAHYENDRLKLVVHRTPRGVFSFDPLIVK